jgi:CRISPR/Cas system-associated protein Cas10 (large subunit of type III CRISPR-Cas system)
MVKLFYKKDEVPKLFLFWHIFVMILAFCFIFISWWNIKEYGIIISPFVHIGLTASYGLSVFCIIEQIAWVLSELFEVNFKW